jgi:hypothetical protein
MMGAVREPMYLRRIEPTPQMMTRFRRQEERIFKKKIPPTPREIHPYRAAGLTPPDH